MYILFCIDMSQFVYTKNPYKNIPMELLYIQHCTASLFKYDQKN